jgi:acyl-CoA synthetase (AMP-forming)/AMP-acid ligase II
VGTNGLAFPIGLFAAAAAGVPFVPLNYRLSDHQPHDLLAPLGDTLVVAEGEVAAALAARGHRVVDAAECVATARAGGAVGEVPPTARGRRCCCTPAARPRRPRRRYCGIAT